MMMRSEDELALFQQMDRDRAKNDPYGPSRQFARLLEDKELPELYLSEDNPVVEEIETAYGRGTRERARVKYDDGLTEEQWLDAVDADDDTIEAAIARKDALVAKRRAKKEARTSRGGDSASEDENEEEEEEVEVPQPKKRSRKPPPSKSEKRKADNISVDGAVEPPKKRGRTNKPSETLSKEDRESLQKVLDIVYEALQDLEEPSADPELGPRGIVDPFVELPPRNVYKDYYVLIKNPICMKQIENKINNKHYQNLKQFRADIRLLCNNCRQYNDDESILFKDANMIERACDKKLQEATADYPQWQDFDDLAPSAPMSVAKPSANTAQPQKSGIKLKLGGPKNPAATPNAGNSSRGGTESALQSDDE